MTTTISNPDTTSAARASEYEADTPGHAGIPLALRALLAGYTDALDSVDDAPVLTWVKPENSRLPSWLAFPALRYFVSTLFVRYLYRRVDALKSGVMMLGVVTGAADEQRGNLEMLEQFEQSLPPRRRLALFVAPGLMVVLAVAYLLAWLCHAGYRNLLGDLMAAAISVSRSAAIAAFQNAYRLAVLQHPLEAYFFAGAAMIVAWSAVVAILPLLPAFYVVRRKKAQLADLENSAFSAVGARTVHDVELDLIVRLLLIPAVALLGVAAVTQAVTQFLATHSVNSASVLIGAIAVALTMLAGIELGACYHERRNGTAHCRSRATRISFAVVTVLSASLFVSLPIWERIHNRENNFWQREVATYPPKPDDSDHARGWLTNQLSFLVTNIQQDVQCVEPHGLLIDHPQYLRFDLEVWSDVDQFANPATAHALALPHWSVRDTHGNSTGSLYLHAKCGRGTEAISEPIVAGAHTSTALVVSAPSDAAVLRLDVPSYRGVWEWHIPPAAG
ncbi:hypothetical protein GCM10009641_62210 [Mycobacterium cookii]|uniref:Uncharacterized protein n=1 Tax=Mycobacterium cookii TaxID=1775 RepID=A0A7I7KX05_9MYCO|nr:hypothetical protein [Mycobacterium cookii]MCV7331848.1 hypothetical protein [Mycobacterium cookii]BBX46048.1 hypothetical protein MCOO_20630 [Mycobacterium cookii]